MTWSVCSRSWSPSCVQRRRRCLAVSLRPSPLLTSSCGSRTSASASASTSWRTCTCASASPWQSAASAPSVAAAGEVRPRRWRQRRRGSRIGMKTPRSESSAPRRSSRSGRTMTCPRGPMWLAMNGGQAEAWPWRRWQGEPCWGGDPAMMLRRLRLRQQLPPLRGFAGWQPPGSQVVEAAAPEGSLRNLWHWPLWAAAAEEEEEEEEDRTPHGHCSRMPRTPWGALQPTNRLRHRAVTMGEIQKFNEAARIRPVRCMVRPVGKNKGS
mmetsp:Transcript_62909/g.159642  ORF Transcript_62909/g.159642 Transcript_62909/m.159642 type:complete len:267 (-) Transcript_62909:34-834(-)